MTIHPIKALTAVGGEERDMSRVPTEVVNRIKREIPVADIAQGLGVDLKKRGKDLIGMCPLHDDKTPSFIVTQSKNLWHCLGACQAGGSVIDLVMRAEGISFRRATDALETRLTGTNTPELVIDHNMTDVELLGAVTSYYAATLRKSDDAQKYLAKRGLKDAKLINQMRLGFANRTLTYQLPDRSLVAGKKIRDRLMAVGVLRESGHEHLNGSLVVPVLNEHGEVKNLYGRKIASASASLASKKTASHLYLPGPFTGVFNEGSLSACSEVILCESLIDALTFMAAGLENVTTSYGTSGLTEETFACLTAPSVERVFIAYDADQAGDSAANTLAERLAMHDVESRRVQFPKGQDANSYALNASSASKSLRLLLESAEVMCASATHKEPRAATSLAASAEASSTDSTSTASQTQPSQTAPPPKAKGPQVEQSGDEVRIKIGDRRYRVRGLLRNTTLDVLKINLLASRGEAKGGENLHVDTFDLYAAKPRAAFIDRTAKELGLERDVTKRDVGKVLLALEEIQERHVAGLMEPEDKKVQLSPAEEKAALALLTDPNLTKRITEDLGRCGLVGEETSKLVAYLATVSRKLPRPLAIMVQSSSSAGKSTLMDSVLRFVPEEERLKYSAMTGQSLYYLGQTELAHKVLAIVEEEGAERASYALKLLQSEGEISIASTGKDAITGKLVTEEHKVKGPVMLFLTTTAIEIDEELMNRCLVLSVNEDREQTRAIHSAQRSAQTLKGLTRSKEREEIEKLHQNAQRLLASLDVVNPFAESLTFTDEQTRTRRDHQKYLSLIQTIALLHQKQRETKSITVNGNLVDYIEVEPSDIALANELCAEVLGRTLDDLPPQTRRLLQLLDALIAKIQQERDVARSEVLLSRKEIREHLKLGDTQLKVHLGRLVEQEHVLPHRRGVRVLYELVYRGQGEDGGPFLSGLIQPDALSVKDRTKPPKAPATSSKTTESTATIQAGRGLAQAGRPIRKAGRPQSRPLVGGLSGGGRGGKNGDLSLVDGPLAAFDVAGAENARSRTKNGTAVIRSESSSSEQR